MENQLIYYKICKIQISPHNFDLACSYKFCLLHSLNRSMWVAIFPQKATTTVCLGFCINPSSMCIILKTNTFACCKNIQKYSLQFLGLARTTSGIIPDRQIASLFKKFTKENTSTNKPWGKYSTVQSQSSITERFSPESHCRFDCPRHCTVRTMQEV